MNNDIMLNTWVIIVTKYDNTNLLKNYINDKINIIIFIFQKLSYKYFILLFRQNNII